MEFILSPWPWYVSGPLIALIMAILLLMGKQFGMSSNLRTICTMLGAGKWVDFFRFDWNKQFWNIVLALGVAAGGFIARNYLSLSEEVNISQMTIAKLDKIGFVDGGRAYLPEALFGSNVWSSPKTLFLLSVGGLLVGFGARYAGGCTSGHAISGLSNLQVPSLLAVIGFFVGGLFMVHFVFPLLF